MTQDRARKLALLLPWRGRAAPAFPELAFHTNDERWRSLDLARSRVGIPSPIAPLGSKNSRLGRARRAPQQANRPVQRLSPPLLLLAADILVVRQHHTRRTMRKYQRCLCKRGRSLDLCRPPAESS